jgi:hypothetical protein
MKDLIGWIIRKTSGWKTIISYILLQIPWFADHPMLIEAIEKLASNPENPQYIGEVILQVLLAIGIIHKLVKPKA